jgi:predicted CXXCH cytochrome family protein
MTYSLRVRLLLLLALPAIGLASALLATAQDARKGDPHAAGSVRLPPGASEVVYCTGCHKSGCPAPHPELVKLTWPAQGRVWLGVVGETTCGTCHAPGFRHAADAFRARDQKTLCGPCHYGAHALSDAHTLPTPVACRSCHALGQAALAHATPEQTRSLITGVDTECMRCHYDGPITHPVGVPNTKKKAPDLPLSADGKMTCNTCHFGHNGDNKFGVLLRKDNRRGGLCLSCHDDL